MASDLTHSMSGGMSRRRWNPERSRWNTEQRRRLIELVKQSEVIWRSPVAIGDYSDGRNIGKVERLNAFRQIQGHFAAEGITVDDCKSQWRHLRDNFVRRYKAMVSQAEPAGDCEKPSWPYFDEMLFYAQDRVMGEEEGWTAGNPQKKEAEDEEVEMEKISGRESASQSALTKRWPMLNEMVLEQPTQQNVGEKDVGAAMKIELGDEEELFTAAEKIEEEHRPKRRKMARKHIEVAKGQQDNGEGSWRNNQEHRFHLNGDSFPTCTAEIGATTDLVHHHSFQLPKLQIAAASTNGLQRHDAPTTSGTATIVATALLEGIAGNNDEQVGGGGVDGGEEALSTNQQNRAEMDRFQFFGSFVELAVRDLYQQDRAIALRLMHTIYSAVSSHQIEATAKAIGRVTERSGGSDQ